MMNKYLAQTAEELSLWEKQKKWQQTAEKLKEKLKEKTDEYTKLLSSYDKLRSVVMSMEREKWYLKSKLKTENSTVAGCLSARPMTTTQQSVTEELQKECQALRERTKELTDRLENEENDKLLLKIEEQRRRIAALEHVSQVSHRHDDLNLFSPEPSSRAGTIFKYLTSIPRRMSVLSRGSPAASTKVEHSDASVCT